MLDAKVLFLGVLCYIFLATNGYNHSRPTSLELETWQWQDEMLSDVEKVQNQHNSGRIIVFGNNSESILTGQNEEDTVVAAAQSGVGRIVVFSHVAFGKEITEPTKNFTNSKFYRNILKWLVGNKTQNSLRFCTLDRQVGTTELSSLQEQCDVLVCYGQRETINSSVVSDFVESGGALVYAFSSSGWNLVQQRKEISQIPYAEILLSAGLSYSVKTAADYDGWFYSQLNKGKSANFGKYFETQPTIDDLIDKVYFLDHLLELPAEHSAQFKIEVDKFKNETELKIKRLFPNDDINCKNLIQRKTLEFWQFIADFQPNQRFKAPCIIIFPGDYIDSPKFSENSINYSSSESDYYFPGSYVAAGTNATLQVTVLVGVWRIFIGAHTDFVSKLPLKRWPKAIRKINILTVGLYEISSYFGGSVVFVSPRGNAHIEAQLSNVVSSPRYDSQNSSLIDSWNASRNSAGLWADISGRYVTFTLPSSSVRSLQDPGPVMQTYDTLLQHYHDLRGTDIDRQRKTWVVTDKQTSNGAMHAGYPIVTHLDVSNSRSDRFLLNESGLKKDTWKFWGIFHEMGHNMQQGEWTFDGTGEVTCNIFALYGMEKIGGIDLWMNQWLNNYVDRAVDYINRGANFNVWKSNPGIALIIYAQLIEAFNWTTYKQVFRHYQNLTASERPKNNQEKIDKWFIIFSQKCNFSLAPLAKYWGIPLSEGAVRKLNDLRLENFLPDDRFTRQTPARIRIVARIFPKLRNQTGG